jgi:transforming growth factor-beta-induced protein
MKRIKYQYLLYIGIALSSITGCSKDDGVAPATNTLQELIGKDSSLTIFNAVLKKTHLETFATGPGPFTFFAPTNAAYKKININSIADLSTLDSNNLVVQTSWLIAAGVKTSDVLVGSNLTVTTLVGTNIFSQATPEATYFNGLKAVKRDIIATNGALQVLDDYLAPTLGTTTVTMTRFPDTYKLWSQAIARAGAATITAVNRSTTTLLSPTNAAMVAGGYDSLTITKTTATALATLVKYHLLGTATYKYALKTGAYKTDQGTNITFNMGATPPTVTGKNGSAQIISLDFSTSNGVIHTINAVLKP